MADVIRVGVMTNGNVLQRWQAESLEHLQSIEGVELVVNVINDTQKIAPRPFLQKIRYYPWRIALYMLYRRKYFKPKAMDELDMGHVLGSIPALRCRTERKGYSEYFTSEDIGAISGMRPDVLIRFGFNIIRGEILHTPRFGVWSFHHGDEQGYRGGPPGFWEIWNNEPTTGAMLQRLTDRLDGGIVLRKGCFKTIDHSLEETVNTVLSCSTKWPAQVCYELLQGRVDAVEGEPSKTDAPIYKYPGNITFIKSLIRKWKNKANFHKEELQNHEQWNIGVLYEPIHALLDRKCNKNVRWLPEPAKDTFRADPFGYITNDRLNVLYEKFDYRTGLGEINRVRPKRDNVLKRSKCMLELDSHLSYPFILQLDDQVYCIPENHTSGGVDIYLVNDENDGLELIKQLIDVPLLDPTLFEHGGDWWLLGTKAPHTNTALYAYHSKQFDGPFTPHPQNPLKQDIRCSRPAGTPFVHEGRLYRPAQDSSETYGGRVAINEVIELSPTAFREHIVRYIEPMPGTSFKDGIHTISAVGDMTLVDGKRYVQVQSKTREQLKRKVRKASGK